MHVILYIERITVLLVLRDNERGIVKMKPFCPECRQNDMITVISTNHEIDIAGDTRIRITARCNRCDSGTFSTTYIRPNKERHHSKDIRKPPKQGCCGD